MIYFKEMANSARNRANFRKFIDADNPEAKSAPMSDTDMDLFWRRYEEAHIFVFDQSYWPTPSDKSISTVATDEPELDLPFRTCAFENLKRCDGSEYLIKLRDGSESAFLCILIHEIEPRKYDLYGMGNNRRMVYVAWTEGRGNPLAWVNIIWLDRLSHAALGVEHVREKVKIGTGREKRFHSIRQIIRIVPKQLKGSAAPAFSREIDWSHRWSVRGHWRRVTGLGKNRAGEYCVEGFTWVTDFVKGPESAPLIDKVRFVKATVEEYRP